MGKDYEDFVARMGSFEMELPEANTTSPPTKYTKISASTLTHYGKLGMHWGRRSGGSGGGKEPRKKMTEAQLNTAKNVSGTSSGVAKEGVNIVKSVSDMKNTRHKEDLSKYTDDELKTRISRMNLEQQYSNLNGSQTTKGQSYAKSTLEITGSVLAIGSSAIGIALAMKQLKGA